MTEDFKYLRDLQSYVPPLVLRRILANKSSLEKPTADRVSAAVLFADITNFTSLSEKLSAHESGGAEELAAVLNRSFDQLITIIVGYGGEITKFAGDALIAIWPVPGEIPRLGLEAQEVLSTEVERAANCALAIQEVFPKESIEGLKVSVEIGISAGDVYTVHLGGLLNRWEYLLSGSPLIEMSQAIDLAGPGQIVLSPSAHSKLDQLAHGERLDGGFFKLVSTIRQHQPRPVTEISLSPELIDNLKVYIPAAILPRMEAGLADWLSELRRVSVMFIMLPDYGASITHPFDRTLPEAQAVMQALQRALYRYGGSINKLNVDDKGITLVAAFGLPPFAHEDDASRSIHSALEMQSVLNHLGRPSAIGVTTGWVYCGPIGNKVRREYTMVGRDVNMATRLMQIAENNLKSGDIISDIFCDETTHLDVQVQIASGSQLAQRLSFGPELKVHVKGKSTPVNVYRPQIRPALEIVKATHQDARSAIMIGRQLEISYLREILENIASDPVSSGGRLIIIEGEAGLGKSIIIKELEKLAREMNVGTLSGAGQRLEQNIKYHAWMPVFRQIYGITEHDDLETRRSRVLAKLPYMPGERGYPALARNLVPLLNQVLQVQFKETSTTRSLSSSEKEQVTSDFFLRLFQIEASPRGRQRIPVRLLILEDAHWLDVSSWDLTSAVINSIPSLSIILTVRPLPASLRRQIPKTGRSILNRKEAEILRLGGLSAAEMEAMVCQLLNVNQLSPGLHDLLNEYTGGHPTLCKELVSHWESSNLLVRSSNSGAIEIQSSEASTFPIPDDIIKNLTGRFDQLSPTQQMILKIASALDDSITARQIQLALPHWERDEAISRHLLDLLRVGFIKEDANSSEHGSYSFSNVIVQEIVRKLLPETYYGRIQSLLFNAR